jgi:hypothetical protein
MTLIHRRGLIAVGACAVAGLSTSARAKTSAPVIWAFDNLQTIGGLPVTSVGAPRLIEGPGGGAIAFDGIADAVFLNEHPLAGAGTFTFEAIFRPDGGAFEQRWFHLESEEQPPVAPGKSNTRMLFEIRVVDRGWYLDAFMTGPGYRQAMMAPDKLFPVGRWHHVAQTYDGRVYRSFVEGVLQMEVATPFTPQGSGRAAAGVRLNRVNYFNGAIRQARFTRRALSPPQFTLRP